MNRLSKYLVLNLTLVLGLAGCAERDGDVETSSETIPDATIEVAEDLQFATIDKIVESCKKLQGTKYNNIVLPKTISISPDAVPCSFDMAQSKEQIIEKKDAFKLIFGEEYSEERFEDLNTGVDFKDKQTGDLPYLETSDRLRYIKNMEPYQWQMVLQGMAIEGDKEKYEVDVTEQQYAEYETFLDKIDSAVAPELYDYRLKDGYAVTYEGHTIDYFPIEIVYREIPFNTYFIFSGDGYEDSKHGVYRGSLGGFDHISFIDKKKIGHISVCKGDEPKNIEEHKEILTPEKALDILSNQLAANFTIHFQSIELVYVGETEDYVVIGEAFGYPLYNMKGVHQELHYHPFWMFTTAPGETWGHGNGNVSAFYVDALTGECSTYTEPRRK